MTGKSAINEIDRWVSQEFENLAQVLADYDPYLRLEWIPPEHRETPEDMKNAFKVVDTRKNQVVLTASNVTAPHEILARIFSMDQKNGNVVANMDAKNAAIQALEMRKKIDEQEANKDFYRFLGKNTKSRWFHSDGTVRDEHYNILDLRRKSF